MSISTEGIREIIEPFLSREDAFTKVDQCGRISNISAMELQDNGIEAKRIDSTFKHGSTEVSHSFVIIPASDVKDISNGPVIVDPTLEQFADETKSQINIDSAKNIDEIEIFKPSDPLYTKYEI